jgi:tetratricopeptide (TPR) repeat protein
MGVFDWLFGKKRSAGPRPPRPKVISGLDDGWPQVVLEMGNAAILMDREQFDYLYGESSAPDPAQHELDELLPRVTRVRAVAGGMFRGEAMGSEAVLDTADAEALAAFRKALKIVEDPNTFSHCSCLGGPTLQLYSGQHLLATIGLQHGHAIRWKKWRHDAQLCNGQALSDWLTRHGVEPAMLDVLLHNQYDAGGLMPLGFRRGGSAPLSRAEQRIRLVELRRVRGGDPEGALAECQKVLDEEPGLALGFAVRAFIHSQRGDHSRCAADCTEAIRLGLREAEVFFARAVARDGLGAPQEALADCTAALEVDPKHVNAYNSRGLIRTRLGLLDRPGSHVDYRLAAAAHTNRAQVYRLKGDAARAAADFQEAERLATNPPRPGQAGTCPHCQGSGACHCKRKGLANADRCARCNGSGKCHVCHGTGRMGR